MSKREMMRFVKTYLRYPHTTNEILVMLVQNGIHLTDREWRKLVREFNDCYARTGLYIASGKKGYVLTTKSEKIKKSAFAKFHTGLSMIRNAKITLKELEDNNQLSLMNEKDIDIYKAIQAFKER